MIRYQFQWLKYQPDATTGEFVLMGYIALCLNTHELSYYLTPYTQRAEHFFAAAPAYFKHTLRQGLMHLDTALSQLIQAPHSFEDLALASTSVLPPNENALQWTPLETGLGISWPQANAALKRQIEQYIAVPARHDAPTDQSLRAALNRVFRSYRLMPYLTAHEAVSKNGMKLHYDHAWKNGVMNVFQPISFDLAKRKSIDNKVCEVHGKLTLLEHSQNEENYKVHLVSAYPTRLPEAEQQEVHQLIQSTFKDDALHTQRVQVALYDAQDLNAFAQGVQQEIVTYHAQK